MDGTCGTNPPVPGNFLEGAIAILQGLPGFVMPNQEDIYFPESEEFGHFETAATNGFAMLVRQSAPYLVNANTAGILIATFMLLTADSVIFRLIVDHAFRRGRFFNRRFETRYQVNHVPQSQARGLGTLEQQRGYVRRITPEGVFLDPAVVFQALEHMESTHFRRRFRSRLDMDVMTSREEGHLTFINVPVMGQGMTWVGYIQMVRMLVLELTRNFLDLGGQPRDHNLAVDISRAVMLEVTGNTMRLGLEFYEMEVPVFMTHLQFDFLRLIMRHSSDVIGRVADLAYQVTFDEPLSQDQEVGGVRRNQDYARLSMNELDSSAPISNPNQVMPFSEQDVVTAERDFRCRLIAAIVTMGRFRRIMNRRDEQASSRRSREISHECPEEMEQEFKPKCAERNENLGIVEREFLRVVKRGKMMKRDKASWLEYYNSQSWSAMREEGAKMSGRTCTGFWSCLYGNYGYRFSDGSFAIGITSLSIGMSDNDNWIFENNNKYDDWNDDYNGQILFDRNGRPVVIIMSINRIFPLLRRTVWVYEFTERNVWKWSRVEWQPPANKLSKNKGPWLFSLRARSLIQVDHLWSLDNSNLKSTQRIVEMHCNDSVVDYHPNWVSYYDGMHMADFETLTRLQFRDGSYALGIAKPERTKSDDVTGDLMTDSWTVRSDYRDERNYSKGPYFGVLIIDRQKRPLLAAFRENTNYISFHYYVDGGWKWIRNENWKNVAKCKGLSCDPEAPRFSLGMCNK